MSRDCYEIIFILMLVWQFSWLDKPVFFQRLERKPSGGLCFSMKIAEGKLSVGNQAGLWQQEQVCLFLLQRKKPGAFAQAFFKICLYLHVFSFRLIMVSCRIKRPVSRELLNECFRKEINWKSILSITVKVEAGKFYKEIICNTLYYNVVYYIYL